MGVIYLRTNKVNSKKYVGQVTTRCFKKRQKEWDNLNQPYAGVVINAARAKYGIEAFGFEILKECNDEELDYWETYYIKELNTKAPYGYNLTDGGNATKGYTHTEETRKKLSEAQKGKESWFKGKHLSEEHKKKISEAQKGEKNHMYGKHHTEEHKKKLSEALKGIKRSDETKRKMSETRKGRKMSQETKNKLSEINRGIQKLKLSKPVFQIDPITNEVIKNWPSAAEVQRQLGYSTGSISRCCNNKRYSHTAYGYKWKYAV